jgi:hypothetical protein
MLAMKRMIGFLTIKYCKEVFRKSVEIIYEGFSKIIKVSRQFNNVHSMKK